MFEHTIVIIGGPTAVGKTAAAVNVAKALNGEIVSCDAMQVYRRLRIACNKPEQTILDEVPHHLLNILDLTQDYDVASFSRDALAAIDTILKNNKVPVLVGGSGMYIKVLLDGIFEQDSEDPHVRQQLESEAADKGLPVLYDQLMKIDPAAAQKIHPHDHRRIVRALEVHRVTGRKISQLQAETKGLWQEQSVRFFGLTMEREKLYQKIDARVDEMFAQGLVEEIKGLSGLELSRTASQIIGIPEVRGFLNGEYDEERARDLMKLNTRHYAKRQMTWFRKEKRIEWIEVEERGGVEDAATEIFEKISKG